MSFHTKTLLGGGGSAPGAPLTRDEEKETERKLKMLTADPINSVFEDDEFKMFKTKQFERAFPGKQKLDATGRGIAPPPVVKDVEPFKPTLRRDDLNIAGSVGEEARNRPAEVIRIKKALSNTGLFDFDVTREKSTDAGTMFTDATKAFQRLSGIEADGCIKPNCPTHKALKAQFFPEGGTNSKASPVDLRPAAARVQTARLPRLARRGALAPAGMSLVEHIGHAPRRPHLVDGKWREAFAPGDQTCDLVIAESFVGKCQKSPAKPPDAPILGGDVATEIEPHNIFQRPPTSQFGGHDPPAACQLRAFLGARSGKVHAPQQTCRRGVALFNAVEKRFSRPREIRDPQFAGQVERPDSVVDPNIAEFDCPQIVRERLYRVFRPRVSLPVIVACFPEILRQASTLLA